MNTGRKIKYWLCGGALAGALAMSAAGWAMGPHPGMDGDPARMIEHIGERLDLSEEQEAAITSELEATRQQSADDRARMGELRKQLKAMSGNFDAGKAQAVADEIGQITARMVYRGAESWSKVYQQLDAGQREKLEAMMAKREKRGGKWHREE